MNRVSCDPRLLYKPPGCDFRFNREGLAASQKAKKPSRNAGLGEPYGKKLEPVDDGIEGAGGYFGSIVYVNILFRFHFIRYTFLGMY